MNKPTLRIDTRHFVSIGIIFALFLGIVVILADNGTNEPSVFIEKAAENTSPRCVRNLARKKIAIIGAGVSGLFTARELVRGGIPGKNIIIYERNKRICGSAISFMSPQPPLAADTGTVIVVPEWSLPEHAVACRDKRRDCDPRSCQSIQHASKCRLTCNLCSPKYTADEVNPSIYKELLAYIKRSGVTSQNLDPGFSRPPVKVNTLNNFKVIPSSQFPSPTAKDVRQLVAAINAYVEAQGPQGVKGTYDEQLVGVGENVDEWQKRSNVGNVTGFVLDGYGGAAPTLKRPGAWVLKALAWGLQFARLKLLSSLEHNKTLLTAIDPEDIDTPIWELLLDPRVSPHPYYLIKQGMHTIFEVLANDLRREGVEIRLSDPVQKLSASGFLWNWRPQVVSKSHRQSFDYVFVSSRPQDTLLFMDKRIYPKQTELYSKVMVTNYVFASAVIEPTGGVPSTINNETNFYPENSAFGTKNVGSARNCHPFGLTKVNRYQLTATMYQGIDENGNLVSQEKCTQILLKFLSRFLKITLTRANLRGIVYYNDWPSSPTVEAVKNGWYDEMEEIQGKQNVFFTGEAFSGLGMTAVARYTIKDTPSKIKKMC